MPYVHKTIRDRIRDHPFAIDDAGTLNYAITRLLQSYLYRNGTNYWRLNDCLGALEGAKLEFYRRVVVPYEDKKKKENGDVY